MSWILTQSGSFVMGTMSGATPAGTVQFRGTFTGTLSGTSLTFTIVVPGWGASAVPACSMNITGSAN